MSFDGIFLHHMMDELRVINSGKLNKINQIGENDYLFDFRTFGKNYSLLISLSSSYARIHLANKSYESVLKPKPFTMVLRKQIEGYKLTDIKMISNDRILELDLSGFNEFQDLCKKRLICEIMGRYSNIILCNDDYTIIEALKHDASLDSARIILPNAKYSFPLQNKINPYLLSYEEICDKFKDITNAKEIVNTFEGASLTLAIPTISSINPAKFFYDALYSLNKPATFLNQNGQTDFYYNSFDNNIIKSYDSLSLLLENYYYEIDKSAKIKQESNDILTFVNRQIKKNQEKIRKIEQDKIIALDANSYKIKGELLLSYPNLKLHADYVEVFNYYDNKTIKINIDSKYDVLENSKRFYKKYQKLKTSLKYLEEQKNICDEEIAYFSILKNQIEHADLTDIVEITEELKNGKYLRDSLKKNNRKQKIKILTYDLDEETYIMVGKNNIQNEYLTHKLAHPNDLWFHVKDAPGSHVVLNKDLAIATEKEIRLAASIAAYYSTYKNSSSVPVNYTLVRYIKKIPGKRACFVSISHEKTIYIDPNEDEINELKVRK
mgnify:FL=1